VCVRANSTTVKKWHGTVWQQCQAASQKTTYPHSLGYALFPLCLVYVGHKFKRCRAGQLCALGRGWIVEIDYIVVGARLDRVDDVQLRESSLRRVRQARMVEDSTQVIPRGGVVRRERNLLLGEALTGDDVCGIRGQSHGGKRNCQRPPP